jgi:hypothetical protein
MSLRIRKYPDLSGPLYHYRGEVVLRFSKAAWTYFLEQGGVLRPIRGVTNTLKIIGGSKVDVLISWAVRRDMEKLLTLLAECRRGDGFLEAPWDEVTELVARAKREHKEILETAGEIGHGAHEHLEAIANTLMAHQDGRLAELLAKWPEDEQSCNAAVAAIAFLVDHNVRFIASEQRVMSREWLVCGTMDGDALIDSCGRPECPCSKFPAFKDKRVVLDYKTSNGVYSSMFGQMALYRKAKCEEFPDIRYDGSVLLRIGKDDRSEFEPWFCFGDELYETHLELFKRALDLKESVDGVDEWMQALTDEVKAKEKAVKEAAKLEAMKVRCPKADDYKGKRLTKCLPNGDQCLACKRKYVDEFHKSHGDARPGYKHWYEPRNPPDADGTIYCACGLTMNPTHADIS